MRVISPDELGVAAAAIKAGELVVAPTNSGYLICADAADGLLCRGVLERLARPEAERFFFVAPSRMDLATYFHLNAEARRLTEELWPGDLALLLPWRDAHDAEKYAVVGSPAWSTLAPGILGQLAFAAGIPLAAVAANTSGVEDDDRGPALTIRQVEGFLAASRISVAAVIDGGVCPSADRMTVVDCFTERAGLVRAGLVHRRAVAAVLGRDV